MEIDPAPRLAKIGGKAYQLHRLKEYCNVPPFFVIAFEGPQEISDQRNQLEIVKQCEEYGFPLMAVRSSANCEDSPHASFAGMFTTVLNVSPSQVAGAIAKVLHSVESKRVRDYCEAKGIDERSIRMAVVVQKMVRSRISGVCFTRLCHDTEALVIEACYGLGEALVGGKVTPDTYTLHRDTLDILNESIGYQRVLLNASENVSEGKEYTEVPFHKRNSKKLARHEIRAIAETCLSIEKLLSFPTADIEWAIEGRELYILQARPLSNLADQLRDSR